MKQEKARIGRKDMEKKKRGGGFLYKCMLE